MRQKIKGQTRDYRIKCEGVIWVHFFHGRTSCWRYMKICGGRRRCRSPVPAKPALRTTPQIIKTSGTLGLEIQIEGLTLDAFTNSRCTERPGGSELFIKTILDFVNITDMLNFPYLKEANSVGNCSP